MIHLKWEKEERHTALEVSSEEIGDLNQDDLFLREMEKELMYDFRDDAIKRGHVNECVDSIRQIHRDHHE